jgi:succinate dehydrogenase/fumarate reductase cytochrome b subunit
MQLSTSQEKKVKQFVPKHKGSSAIWWIMQRLTGAMLFFLILFHMLVNHYSSAHLPADIVSSYGIASFQAVQWKMINFPLYSVISILFVLTVVFHMLNGFRTVILDLAPGKLSKRVLAMILLLIGFLLVAYVLSLNYLVGIS